MIKLRRLESTDASRIASLANNKNVWDNLRDYIPYPYEEKDAEYFIGLTKQEDPAQTFGIINSESELCGVIGLVLQKDVYKLSAEIGYWLGEAYWGKGISTKAVELITAYGFDQLNLERIYTGVFDFNKASMRVLEKNGYTQEGLFRKAVIKNGNRIDEYRYSKLKDE